MKTKPHFAVIPHESSAPPSDAWVAALAAVLLSAAERQAETKQPATVTIPAESGGAE